MNYKDKIWHRPLRKWIPLNQDVNNPIYKDKEAMKALQILKDKGYTSEDVVEQLWRMDRGKT